MNNIYPHEKFSNAVCSMASSPKTIQDRIGDAYIYNLMHIKPEELPDEIKHRFIRLCERMTSAAPVRDEGSVVATVGNMTTQEAVEIADEILFMADVVQAAYHNR